jgi:hypothetical protein
VAVKGIRRGRSGCAAGPHSIVDRMLANFSECDPACKSSTPIDTLPSLSLAIAPKVAAEIQALEYEVLADEKTVADDKTRAVDRARRDQESEEAV